MDFTDGTMYIKHDGQLKPFMTLNSREGYQTKAYGQCSHAEGHTTKDALYDYLFEDVKTDTNKYESTTLELQVQVKMLNSQMEEVTAAIKELKEEIDRINKRDAFDRYFGVDYLNSKDF